MSTAESIRVLVIEDAPEFRTMLAAVLGKEGWSVTLAEDGETGLQRAESDEIGRASCRERV